MQGNKIKKISIFQTQSVSIFKTIPVTHGILKTDFVMFWIYRNVKKMFYVIKQNMEFSTL